MSNDKTGQTVPAPANAKSKKSKPDENVVPAAAPASPPRRRRWLRTTAIALVSIIGPVAAIIAGTYIYLVGGRYVSTDNAYVKADKIAVSSDISGRVLSVHVRTDDHVAPGTLLFRLDPEPFRIAVERAEAKLLAVRQDFEAMRHLYRQKLANLKRAQTDIAFYQQQFDRQRQLSRRRIASQVNFDTAKRNLQIAQDQVTMLTQELAQVRVKLGGTHSTPAEQQAAIREALAAVKQAKLDLKHTEIRAAVAGIVTNFDLQRGEYVKAGEVTFSIVGSDDIWVQANFRETDLTHVRPGQRATVRIDAYPDQVWEASVESISPATGAEFALLPPQNATGNWVKVVQRLPVRLALKPRQGEPPLRAGMTATVSVDTRRQRQLSNLLGIFGAAIASSRRKPDTKPVATAN
ncbi:MAG: HlyD family secretion protein [Hyphomicrobiaceae bacterium]|nr:HlyD family secretion protein [Hyphomicrobiaceae bacterium]